MRGRTRGARRWAGWSLMLMGLGGPSGLQAQTPGLPPVTRSARSGVFTAEQAREGGVLFEQYCSRCHSAQEYRSERFRIKWTSRPLRDLYVTLSATMPFDQPASLRPTQYAELLAFILEVNGLPAGNAELASDERPLAGIVFDPPP